MTMAHAAEIDPDLAAIEATRQGDRSAFDPLVRRHSRWVKGVIFGVLGDSDRTDDVAQQAIRQAGLAPADEIAPTSAFATHTMADVLESQGDSRGD